MNQIRATVLADSITRQFHRLITLEVEGPKFLDAEWRTHRMLCQSSSSDRAIPINRSSRIAPFLPTDVRVAGPGMQQANPVESFIYDNFRLANEILHQKAIDVALHYKEDIHKQHLNRLLLPWAIQKKVVTATKEQWLYFFKLRDSEDADPAMRQMATAVRRAIYESTPVERESSWHLPYIRDDELATVFKDQPVEVVAKVSAARCARTSYNRHDGTDTTAAEDMALADRLIRMSHWTPFEHQAYPMNVNPGLQDSGVTHMDRYGEMWSAQFNGWVQHRKLLDG